MSADLEPQPDSVHYRTARPDDVAALVSIAAACSEGHQRFSAAILEYMARQPSCRIFVADAEPIVGFVVAHKLRGRTGEIVAVDVAPDARGLDIATALLTRGEAWLAANGAETIYLEVDAANRPARGLYAKAGYQAREEFEEDGRGRLLMRKVPIGCPLHAVD